MHSSVTIIRNLGQIPTWGHPVP